MKFKMILLASATAAAALLGSAVNAQILNSVSVNPASVKVGEATTITANIDVMNGNYCGFTVKFGDGTTADGISDPSHPAPHTFQHTYKAPGSYSLNLVGNSVENHPNCGGDTKVANVTVTGAAAAAPAASKTPTAAAQCPAGWTVVKASVNKKTGAFTCSAKKGTAMPEGKLSCPANLSYFENAKKLQLGCKP